MRKLWNSHRDRQARRAEDWGGNQSAAVAVVAVQTTLRDGIRVGFAR